MEEQEEVFYSKRKFIIEFNDFSGENYERFLEEANNSIEHPFRDFHLASNGGKPYFINPIKKILEEGDFTMTGYSHLFSAGFLLYMYTDVEKVILENTVGAFHYPILSGVTLNNNNTLNVSSKLDKFMYDSEVYNVDFFRELLGITNAQHKKLEASADEWLIYDYKKMRKLSDKSLRLLEQFKK